VTLHFSCPASQELFRPPWPAPTKISLQQPNKKKLKGNLKDSCASPELWLSRAGRKKKGRWREKRRYLQKLREKTF
jgi:hypothetical protein